MKLLRSIKMRASLAVPRRASKSATQRIFWVIFADAAHGSAPVSAPGHLGQKGPPGRNRGASAFSGTLCGRRRAGRRLRSHQTKPIGTRLTRSRPGPSEAPATALARDATWWVAPPRRARATMALPRPISCALASSKAKSWRWIASLRDPGRDSQWAMMGRLAAKKQSGAKG